MTESPIADPAPTRAERLAVGALALASFGMALNSQVLAALGPYLRDAEIGIGPEDLGWLLAAASYAGAIGALLLGPLVDRYGRRGPLLCGAVLFTVATTGYLVAQDFWTLFAVRAATGFAAGVVFTGASAAVSDLVPYSRRGGAMGILTAAVFLAVPIGMPLAVLLAEHVSWRGIFAVQLVAAGASVFCIAAAVPTGLGRGGEAPRLWAVMRAPMVIPALLAVLLYTGAFFTTVQFVGVWLDEARILPRNQQVWMWVTLGLGSALGSVFLGRLSDRLGKRNFVLWASLGVALCLLLVGRVTDLAMLLAVGLPLAVMSASRSASLLALISNIVEPRHRGTLLGLRAAAVNLGMAAFSGLGGKLYEQSGFQTLTRMAAIAVVVSYFCVRGFVRERMPER